MKKYKTTITIEAEDRFQAMILLLDTLKDASWAPTPLEEIRLKPEEEEPESSEYYQRRYDD